MSASLVIEVEGGGSAEIVETDGARVVLLSTVSSPPGSTLTGVAAEVSRPFRVKVRGCRQLHPSGCSTPPGVPQQLAAAPETPRPFRIEGRFVDITKEQRDLVVPGRSRSD